MGEEEAEGKVAAIVLPEVVGGARAVLAGESVEAAIA